MAFTWISTSTTPHEHDDAIVFRPSTRPYYINGRSSRYAGCVGINLCDTKSTFYSIGTRSETELRVFLYSFECGRRQESNSVFGAFVVAASVVAIYLCMRFSLYYSNAIAHLFNKI